MSTVLRYIEKAIVTVIRLMSNVGVIFVALATFLITADVVGRYFFNKPVTGAHELIAVMVVVIIALGVARNQNQKANIEIDLLTSRLPQKAQAGIAILTYLLSLGIVSLLTWQAFVHSRDLLNLGQKTLELKIFTAPFQLLLAIGFLMLFIVLLIDLFYAVVKVIRQ
jgi:TRAP-type C4-dicarboxylate transport system permease small subunit